MLLIGFWISVSFISCHFVHYHSPSTVHPVLHLLESSSLHACVIVKMLNNLIRLLRLTQNQDLTQGRFFIAILWWEDAFSPAGRYGCAEANGGSRPKGFRYPNGIARSPSYITHQHCPATPETKWLFGWLVLICRGQGRRYYTLYWLEEAVCSSPPHQLPAIASRQKYVLVELVARPGNSRCITSSIICTFCV